MAYDASKDVKIAEFGMFGEDAEENFFVSIQQYNGGEKKIQIGPRSYFTKKGEVRFAKAGRLSAEEFTWLTSILPDVLKAMEQ